MNYTLSLAKVSGVISRSRAGDGIFTDRFSIGCDVTKRWIGSKREKPQCKPPKTFLKKHKQKGRVINPASPSTKHLQIEDAAPQIYAVKPHTV